MTSTPTASSDSEPRPRGRLRLQHRIVLPVVAVALVTSGGAAWVAVSVTADALQSRVRAQLVSSAAAVGRGGFALNATILRNLRDIVGAQIVTVGPGGTVVASSEEAPSAGLLAAARRAAATAPAPEETPQAFVSDCGFACLVAVRQVDGQPGTAVVLVSDMKPLDDASRSVARAILLSALVSVVLLLFASQLVVTRLTAPLEQLVTFVRGLAPRDSRRAPVGDNEVGELSEAFNGMLDRLATSQAAVLRSEKLSLAGLFAARIAHDIRNPLSAIRMQAQMLRRSHAADRDASESAAAILRDATQVESVVRDLMELANPGDLRLEPSDVNDVIRDALHQVSAQFAYRKIDVQLDLAEALPPVPLDANRFKQALLNVLVNGSEAMHTGGRLEVSSGLNGDGTVWVKVCDDGVGVPPEVLERVFDPFVTTKPDGVGLGLVNVKAVVDGHGGRITLEPRQPRGTCAHIRLRTAHG
jgi:signal transduction histidine kinase